MSESTSTDLTSDLHNAALQRDQASINRLAERILPGIERALRAAFRLAPNDFVADSAADALLEYLTRCFRLMPSTLR